jgi:hypothetical protein
VYELRINISGSSRNELRRKVTDEFFKEKAGTEGGGETSRYTYYVEKLDGKRIF